MQGVLWTLFCFFILIVSYIICDNYINFLFQKFNYNFYDSDVIYAFISADALGVKQQNKFIINANIRLNNLTFLNAN